MGEGGGEAPGAARPSETTDPPAPPFPGGGTLVNESGGYSVGVPHGWQPARDGGVTVLTSPDGVVTVAITADRSNEALEAQPAAIARTAITALRGVSDVRVNGPTPFEAHYPAVEAGGTATRASDGLRQSFRSFVLVRPQLAVFTALASRNAKAGSPFARQVDGIVRSIRGRPVSVAG